MDLTCTAYLIVCPLVFIGSFMDAIAGGGGLITLPAYVLAGVPMHYAIGTNKLSSFIGVIFSTFRYWRSRLVDLGFIFPSIVASLAGSAIGAKLALMLDEKYLKYMLMIVLPLAAFAVLRPKAFDDSKSGGMPRRKGMILAAAISFVVGGYDGFYGPGAGTFFMLLYVAIVKMDIRNAAGSAKMTNMASNVAAMTMFLNSGKVHLALGLTAAVFSIAGHWLGAGLAIRKGSAIVRPVVLVVLVLLMIKIATE
ncbi:TSUP family transporter [Deltaproteobacteria bacterium OttesenSCG-928-K17]|nr:TSUP family transporter [Deltaproteobacteria bacterium OttesenSCG-928-K17]